MTLIISLFKNFPLVSGTKYLAAAGGDNIPATQKGAVTKPLSMNDLNDYHAAYCRSWGENASTPSAHQIATMEMWNRMTDAPISGLRSLFRG
ncbi:MAG TPA: hypothetical protein PKW15_05290 [Alphaproteobacteria bacterium]|nr:hypothetical protein [Rhodospirillaceae bacterium]HRJ12640.1 hypothetical protein [Alphaproteobacteria bacterium]